MTKFEKSLQQGGTQRRLAVQMQVIVTKEIEQRFVAEYPNHTGLFYRVGDVAVIYSIGDSQVCLEQGIADSAFRMQFPRRMIERAAGMTS